MDNDNNMSFHHIFKRNAYIYRNSQVNQPR